MRVISIALIGLAMTASSGAAFAINTKSEDVSTLVLHSTLSSVTGDNSGVIAPIGEVKSGEMVTITGACVAEVNSADKLRVVLMFADPSEAQLGYHLLATEQEIRSGGLDVRVPDLPDTESRVFLVKVFQLGQDVPQICEAGSIRIGAASKVG